MLDAKAWVRFSALITWVWAWFSALWPFNLVVYAILWPLLEFFFFAHSRAVLCERSSASHATWRGAADTAEVLRFWWLLLHEMDAGPLESLLQGWFQGEGRLGRQNAADLLSWMLHHKPLDESTGQERALVEQCLDDLDAKLAQPLPPGRGAALQPMLHTFGPLPACHKPLCFYLALQTVHHLTLKLLRLAGFRLRRVGELRYMAREARVGRITTAPPLVFLHGVGGLAPYLPFLYQLRTGWDGPLLMPLFPDAAISTPPSPGPRALPVAMLVSALKQMVERHSHALPHDARAAFCAHSLGTGYLAALMKARALLKPRPAPAASPSPYLHSPPPGLRAHSPLPPGPCPCKRTSPQEPTCSLTATASTASTTLTTLTTAQLIAAPHLRSQEHPRLVAAAVFSDPICFLLHQRDVLYAFLYRTAQVPLRHCLDASHWFRWLLHALLRKEPTIQSCFRREFCWSQCVPACGSNRCIHWPGTPPRPSPPYSNPAPHRTAPHRTAPPALHHTVYATPRSAPAYRHSTLSSRILSRRVPVNCFHLRGSRSQLCSMRCVLATSRPRSPCWPDAGPQAPPMQTATRVCTLWRRVEGRHSSLPWLTQAALSTTRTRKDVPL